MSERPAVLVIGIDGADWQIIEQFRHRLPNLDSLIRIGTSGYLRSCLPYVTFPAWKCYSTGMNPDKLGVYGWEKVDFVRGTMRPVISTDFSGREIWDIAGAVGCKCCVLNMPSTYPVKPINGVMLAGPPVIATNDLSKVVYPLEMTERIKALPFYPSASWVAEKDKLFREVKQLIGEKCDLAVSLLKQGHWDFFQFTFFLNDPIQHLFWDIDNEGLPMSMLGELWQYIDTHIGRMLDLAPRQATTIVVSDHGFAPLKGILYINDWLEQEGYLHVHPTPAMLLQRLVPAKCIHGAIRAAQWRNLAGVILSMLPKSLRSKLVPNPFGWPLESSQIDWIRAWLLGAMMAQST